MKNKTRLSSGEIYRKYGIVLIMIFLFIASAAVSYTHLVDGHGRKMKGLRRSLHIAGCIQSEVKLAHWEAP